MATLPASTRPLNIALIGAGIFAREAHAPAWARLAPQARVAAVWSRTPANAAALAATLPQPAQVVTDLEAIWRDPTIDAVDIVLPIDAQPALIGQALTAGKHVISEKPIAPDAATAQALLARWQGSGLLWMVAENYRYESAYTLAAALVRDGAIGAPVTAHWALYAPVDPANKYYHTSWRRTGQIAGGFLLDGGVHHIAALRQILGEVETVRAEVRQFSPDLPPADTLSATLRFASGALGSYLVSYAVNAFWPTPLHIAGTQGSLRTERGYVEIARHGGAPERHAVALRDGVEAELAAFVQAAQGGAPHSNTPQEALRDLQVIEAMLHSAESGQAEGVGV